jgi:DNA polymerase III alpha subunit (gram-positive type)
MGLSADRVDYQGDMGGYRCNTCGSSDLITVTMTVDGQAVSFTACHDCQTKWWFRDGERVALESVLDLVASK